MKKSKITKTKEDYKNINLDTWEEDLEKRHDQKNINRRENNIKWGLETANLRLKNKRITIYDIDSFDVETISRANNFYLFGYLSKKGFYKTFKKEDAIKKLVQLRHRKTLIYATNLGFDFNSLCDGTDFRSQVDILIRGNNFIMVKFNGSYVNVKLLDSFNYGGLNVESMGKILKKPKLKKPRALGRTPKNKKELDELVTYNNRDCEITRDFMLLVQQTLNSLGGELKSTISSCAMDIFRRNYLKYDVIREELILNRSVKDKIFKAYYGGRTEVFSRGKITNYYYGDINSLYPSQMLKEFPNPMSVNFFDGENRDLLQFEGVSYFVLEIPFVKYPLLPLRIDGKLVFPCGLLKGYYTHVEIRRAKELYGEKIILVMNDTIYYTETKKFFKEYVEDLYRLRKEYTKENNEMSVVIKLLLNSLYGKFAMKHIEQTTFFNMDNYEEALTKVLEAESKGQKIHMNSINEGYTTSKEEYDGVSSFPIWSVYVTAYARIKLHELILEYNPVYVDTDSIFTKTKILDSKELGELKIEKMIHHGIVIKPKLYFIDETIKSKGVPIPKNQKDKERLKQKILQGKIIQYDKFVKTKEGLGRDIKINSLLLTQKRINLEDSKRVWNSEKFNPDVLEESNPMFITEKDYHDKET